MRMLLQLPSSLKEALTFLSFQFLLMLCSADESWLRFSGLQRVDRGYKISPDSAVTSVSSRSLVACVSACLESNVHCFSVNFQPESGTCELLVSGSGSNIVPNPGWRSVTLTKQTVTTASTATVESGCPDNFVPFQEKCYFVERNNQKNIPDARADCDKLSAELLSLETREEQTFVNQIILDNDHNIHLWTSGQGLGTNAYQWSSSGVPMAWTDFTPGFPGGYYGQDSCVYIDGFRLTWKTDSCDVAVNRYICEYPKTV